MTYSFYSVVDGLGIHLRTASKISTHLDLANERPHKHYFIEFHYMFEGEEQLNFLEQQREVVLREGELLMIPREVYHATIPCPSKSAKRLCFDFNVDAEEPCDHLLYRLSQRGGDAVILKEKEIAEGMERALKVFQSADDPLQEERLGIILTEVVLEVFRRLASKEKAVHRPGRLKLWQKWLIEEHVGCQYHLPNGLEVLSQKLYLSQRQTRKLIRQFYGTGYKELILRERIGAARLLLRSTSLSMEEIAEKVGYSSYSGFHLAFTKTAGTTPGDYRKSNKNPVA